MTAVLNIERTTCFERLIIFENELHQTKSGKQLNNYDNFSYLYTHVEGKWQPIEES